MTLQELLHGSPTREAMTTAEFNEWCALITLIEPEEKREANS